MKKQIFQMLILACLAVGLSACSAESSSGAGKTYAGDGPISAVATTGMVADAVKAVGGERVRVEALMGPGVDPHLYKASEGDVARMSKADMIFYNGLHLEGKMTEVFEKLNRIKPTVALGEAVEKSRLFASQTYTGSPDPHIWFDVSIWMQVVRDAARALAEFDPAHAQTYQHNADVYLAELESLHREVGEACASVPEGKRVLITAHDAFHYFGKAYGFEVRGLQGISTATEAGTGDVQELAAFIYERKIPAIFVESSVPTRYIEALQAAVQSRGFDVKIGGSLFSDAMGAPGTPEGSYPGMVRHNVKTIVNALLGKDPA